MTLRPIAPGEEITVSYHNNCIADRNTRRRANWNKLGFWCRCHHCVEAVEEEATNDIGTAAAGILRAQEKRAFGLAYQRHCRRLFATLHKIQLVGWHWKDWCTILAGAAEHMMEEPDWIRVYYFRRLELEWCEKWLEPSHMRIRDLNVILARLRRMERVADFASISWDFLTSESAQRVFFGEELSSTDRLRGEDCLKALQELQTKERKKKKNLASKKNKARKKANRAQDTDTAQVAPGPTAGPVDDAAIPANPPEEHQDGPSNAGGSALSNEASAATSLPHSQPSSPTQHGESEWALVDDNVAQSATAGTQEIGQDDETRAQDTTPTAVPAPAASDDTTAQTQEATSAIGELSISTAVAPPEALPSQTGDLNPADDAMSRTLSANSTQSSPTGRIQQLSGQIPAGPEPSASPSVSPCDVALPVSPAYETPSPAFSPAANPEDVELPVSPADETPSPASMTPVTNQENFDVAQSPFEGSRQGVPSPNGDISGSHSIQASELLSQVGEFSLDPVVAPQEVLQAAPVDAHEDQQVDTCPDLEQVQSSSDEADYPNIPTPNESSADDNVPDQVVAAQEDTPVPDPSARALEPSKQQS